MTSSMKRCGGARASVRAYWAGCLILASCGGGGEPLGTVLDESTVVVGDVEQRMTLGSGSEETEVVLPVGVVAEARSITVRLMGDVMKSGYQPMGPCVQVADKDVTFSKPAKMRRKGSRPAKGQKMMGMHAGEKDAMWVPDADAAVVGVLVGGGGDAGSDDAGSDDAGGSPDADAAGSPATFEIDVKGSGLWAMAIVADWVSAGDGGVTGTSDGGATTLPDGGVSTLPDGGDPSSLPQLTHLLPAAGTAGTQIMLEVHGRNITDGWTIAFDGVSVATTIASLSDGPGATATVTLPASIVTGQVPVWLALGTLRSNTLYFTVAAVAGAPTIVDYTPDNALPGATISIIGTNFAAEPVTIRDPLGRVIPVVTTTTTTWVGATRDRVDIVIPADMPSGVLTAANSKGSYRGRIFNVGQNLARAAGAVATSSTQYNTTNWSTVSGWDNNLQTSWFSGNYDCATNPACTSVPFFQVAFAAPQVVGRIAMRGNREYMSGYDFLEGWFEVIGPGGATLWRAAYLLPEPDRDLDIVFPTPIPGAAAVRFTSIADESVEPGFSELEVFGPP